MSSRIARHASSNTTLSMPSGLSSVRRRAGRVGALSTMPAHALGAPICDVTHHFAGAHGMADQDRLGEVQVIDQRSEVGGREYRGHSRAPAGRSDRGRGGRRRRTGSRPRPSRGSAGATCPRRAPRRGRRPRVGPAGRPSSEKKRSQPSEVVRKGIELCSRRRSDFGYSLTKCPSPTKLRALH